MSIEALLERVAVGLEANTEQLKIIEAGRQASLDQLMKQAATAGEQPKTRTRKKADAEQPEGNGAGAAESGSTAESPPASQSTAPTPAAAQPATLATVELSQTEIDLRAATTAYIEGGATNEDKADRTNNIKAIMQHFGGGMLVGPKSTLEDDQRKQALFYVKRYSAGVEVNFSQDYDFSGDPTQDSAQVGDEFDIG